MTVIVFDLGKVILNFDNGLIASRLAALSGRPEDEIRRIVFGTLPVHELDRGRITPEGFFRALKECLSLPITYEEFKPLWCRIFSPIPGMEELISRMKGSYRLGLLSNTNALHFEYLEREYPVLSLFDHHFLSFRLKLVKPEPAIYDAVLEHYRVPPREIIYFDDIPAYVAAARALGIQAVQFESARQVTEVLAGFKVSPA